jgi:hypothetical protein
MRWQSYLDQLTQYAGIVVWHWNQQLRTLDDDVMLVSFDKASFVAKTKDGGDYVYPRGEKFFYGPTQKDWPMMEFVLENNNQFERLPANVVHLIFHYLTPLELLTVAEVSMAFYQLSRSDLSWVHHKSRVLGAMPNFLTYFNNKMANGGLANRAIMVEPNKKRFKSQVWVTPHGIWRVFVERLIVSREFVDTRPEQLRIVKRSGLLVFAEAMRLNIPFHRYSIIESVFVKENYGYGAMKGVRFSIKADENTTFRMWFYLPARIGLKSNYVIYDFGLGNADIDGMYYSPYLFEPFVKFIDGDDLNVLDTSFGLRNDPELYPDAMPVKNYLDMTFNYWQQILTTK